MFLAGFVDHSANTFICKYVTCSYYYILWFYSIVVRAGECGDEGALQYLEDVAQPWLPSMDMLMSAVRLARCRMGTFWSCDYDSD